MDNQIHDLKLKAEYYQEVLMKKKNFELRKNDRNFKIGDKLKLNEIDDSGNYTGRFLYRTVTYILYGPCYGLSEGYCILSIN